MATVDVLQVVISAESAKFQSEMGKVRGELGKLNTAASNATSKLSVGMIAAGTAIGHALAGIFAKTAQTIGSAMGDAVTRLDTLNNFPRVMGNLGISSKDAETAINYLSEKLQGLPTTLDAAALAVQRFASANGNVQASTKMFLAFNNAVLAGGASAEIQKSALEQLSQAYAKGKPDMMEWRTLMMAMPAQLRQIANAMGYVDASALGEALRSGTVSMNEFMNTIVQLNKTGVNGLKSFEEQARGGVAGVQTSLVNLKTAITRAITDIMNAIGQSNIAGFFNAIASAVSTAANYVAAFIRVVLTAINALRALFGQSAISFGQTKSSADSASTAVGGIGAAANNATDAIGGTSKAAKKLQHQLAGFDEMTVLKENDTSGSGGGGGGASAGGVGNMGDLADFKLDTSAFEKSADKVEEIAKKIKQVLKGMFNFDKIGKAIKRFADDVGKFLKPAGKILDDLWGYIKPFISWVGNDLLPAFLNALGGAINLLGQVIGAIWNNALKPFIDFFLVPIAQFTGGIIVNVLNAIGDGLRAIAENKVAVDVIAGIATGIAAAVVAYQAYELVMGVVNALELAHQGLLVAGTASSGAYAVGVGLVTAAQSACATATGMLSAAMSLLPFAAVGLAVAAVVTAIGIFGEQIENARRKNESLKGSTEAYLPVLDESAEKYDKNKDGVLSYTESLERLDSAITAQNDAELKMINTEKALAEKTKILQEYADKYGVSVDDLISLHKTGQLETIATGEEYNKLTEATINVEQATIEARAASEKFNEEQGNLQSVANQTKEQYDALGEKMVKSAEQGKMATTEWYNQEIELQRLREEIEATGKNVGQMKDWYSEAVAAGTKLGEGLSDGFQCKVPDAQRSGMNLGQGGINGINSKQRETYNAGWNQADAGIRGFNDRARNKSPSRVMMKSGGYFTEGIAIGIKSMVGDVKANAAAVADAANTSFSSNITSFQEELKSTSTDFAAKNEVNLASVVEANSQAHVVVKVGEDTLIDRIVRGINDSSFLGNANVINV